MEIGQRFNPYKLFTGCFIPNSLAKYKGLTALSKLVWARLAQYAGEDGICYPSLKTLAEEVGATKQGVIKAIKQLIKEGFIEQEKPSGMEMIMHKTSRYYFLWHSVFEADLRPEVTSQSKQFLPPSDKQNLPPSDKQFLPKENQLKRINEREYIYSNSIQFSNENFMPTSPETSLEISSSKGNNNETGKHKQADIVFDEETYTFKGIEPFIDKWKSAYPAVNVETEIKQMESWVMSQPKTRWKKNWKRFITGWLSREQERQEFRKAKFGERRSFLDD